MIAGPNWKPDACADCGAPHPAWSLTGPAGPWRCFACNTTAAPVAASHTTAAPVAASHTTAAPVAASRIDSAPVVEPSTPPPTPPKEGLLL